MRFAMSRLSGFVVSDRNNKELFSITWKNYLAVDSAIWAFGWDNHFWDDLSTSDENTILITDYESFEGIFNHLKELLTLKFFQQDTVQMHTPSVALSQWNYILNKIEEFLQKPLSFKDSFSVEYFSCC